MDILNWEEELDGDAMLGPYEVWKSIEFMLGIIWDFYTLTISSLSRGPQKLLSPQWYSLILPLIVETSYLPLKQREPCIFPVCLKEAYIFILCEEDTHFLILQGRLQTFFLTNESQILPSVQDKL